MKDTRGLFAELRQQAEHKKENNIGIRIKLKVYKQQTKTAHMESARVKE